MRVEEREVGYDDRDGQGDAQHAGQSAQGAHEHPDIGLGDHVAVAHCCHGHDGPPQAHGDALKVIVRVVLDALRVVDERREDNDAEYQEEDEQNQLLGARLERVDEDLQAGRVPRELAEPHDPDDAEELQHVTLLLQLCEHEVQVEAEGGHNVYNVHRCLQEVQLDGRHGEAYNDLKREPGVRGALYIKERLVRLRLVLLQAPRERAVSGLRRGVSQNRDPHLGVGLQAERYDGGDDEKHGDHGDDLGGRERGRKRVNINDLKWFNSILRLRYVSWVLMSILILKSKRRKKLWIGGKLSYRDEFIILRISKKRKNSMYVGL